jgi:hypothetical protein
MNCKIFYNENLDKLQSEINEWFDDNQEAELVTTKYLATDEIGPHTYLYSVLIIYK